MESNRVQKSLTNLLLCKPEHAIVSLSKSRYVSRSFLYATALTGSFNYEFGVSAVVNYAYFIMYP